MVLNRLHLSVLLLYHCIVTGPTNAEIPEDRLTKIQIPKSGPKNIQRSGRKGRRRAYSIYDDPREVNDQRSGSLSSSPGTPDPTDQEFTSRYLSEYNHVRTIGRGGFGVVFEAVNQLDGCNYAVKRIKVSNELGAHEKVMREVKALAKLDHPGIVRFYCSWMEQPPKGWQEAKDKELGLTKVTDDQEELSFTGESNESSCCSNSDGSTLSFDGDKRDNYLYIQMQLCRKMTLKDWLSVTNNRDRSTALELFKQILSAIEYVHDKGLMHRDIKPNNIFFSFDGQVKLGDFGLVADNVECEVCRRAVWTERFSDVTHDVGTCLYMSPEQLLGLAYTNKVDIWALGIVYFELLVSFGTEMERFKSIKDIRELRFSADFERDNCTEWALLKKLLASNPDERPSAAEIRHDYLNFAKPTFNF